MKLDVTNVFKRNWAAIHEKCPDCDGTGLIDDVSCSRCGDGESWQRPGSGRKYKYIINTGASRSSKTISLIDLYDLYARHNKNKRLTVWRDTKIDCKKTVLVDALKRHKNTKRYQNGYKFNKTESIFEYSNSSTVEIHGTDDEETVHGLTQDAAWLNEPYKISIDTFDQIDQRTSDFLIIDWNPKKDHWIDNLAKRDNSIVIHSTYKDNPFCPPEQRKKIESYQPVSHTDAVLENKIKEQDAHSYDFEENPLELEPYQVRELLRCVQNEQSQSANQYKWEVYGLGKKAERPNRIFHFKEIKHRDYLHIDAPVFYGVDWGVVDPMGIIEVKYYDGALYVHELSYKSENDLKSQLDITEISQINSQVEEGFLMWYFKRLGVDMSRPIICDNNRPMKIVALRVAGYNWAVAAEKKAGSIIDGIDMLNNLDVYYTQDSKNLAYEQEMYSRRVDPRTGEVLEEPEDSYNHCFVGDTLITTFNGQIPIKDIQIGDYVLTSEGYKKVLHKFDNGIKKVSEYRLNDIYLYCTDNHKVKTTKGWKEIKDISVGDILYNPKEMEVNILERKEVSDECVYDLMVEDCHEYFANGVLVHNCLDPLRYVGVFLQSMGIIKVI